MCLLSEEAEKSRNIEPNGEEIAEKETTGEQRADTLEKFNFENNKCDSET